MKTFRRYLLSYLCTLLLPVLVLSVVIYEVIVSYYGAQLLEQNLSSLQQLSLAVSMQRDQLDAYAVQTTNRSEFFYRNQQNPGDIFQVQSILTRWIAENGFIDDICYYNPRLNKVYACDAVYSVDDYARWRMRGLLSEEISEIIGSDNIHCWRLGEDQLYYFASARVSPTERNWLICRLSRPTLDAMIEGTRLYNESGTYICDADGTVLYASDLLEDAGDYLGLAQDSGIVRIGQRDMMYARLEEHGLTFLSVVPEVAANQSIARIWKMVYIGLFFILVLGAVVIAYVMRLNYKPIRELEADVLQTALLPECSPDALQNVRRALQMMKNSHTLAMNRTVILDKERIILRLLMGSYASVEQFNCDGRKAGVQLCADRWYLVNMRLMGDASAHEDALMQAASVMQLVYADREDMLYLEIPENNQLILIISGNPLQHEKTSLVNALCDCSLEADVLLGVVCTDIRQLSQVWQEMSSKQPHQHMERVYPKEIYEALLNAIEFGESDRIRFAIEMLIAGVRRLSSAERIRTVCGDVIRLARGKLPEEETVSLLDEATALTAADRQRAEEILRRMSELLCTRLEQVPEDEPTTLIQQIEQYLQQHYCEAEFTVQKAAAYFDLSMSNMGHYFKSHTGVTVSDYVESLRLNLAQTLLRDTDKSIAEISAQVGYLQPASFMRAFKKVLGVSPTNWRNEQRLGS